MRIEPWAETQDSRDSRCGSRRTSVSCRLMASLSRLSPSRPLTSEIEPASIENSLFWGQRFPTELVSHHVFTPIAGYLCLAEG